jgi:hypothetical protein
MTLRSIGLSLFGAASDTMLSIRTDGPSASRMRVSPETQ